MNNYSKERNTTSEVIYLTINNNPHDIWLSEAVVVRFCSSARLPLTAPAEPP